MLYNELDFDIIGIEYHKVQLLKIFKRFCFDMKDKEKNLKIRELYRNGISDLEVTKKLLINMYDEEIEEVDNQIINKWIQANLRKTSIRKMILMKDKIEIINKQEHKCNICKNKLSDEISEVHIDHIIPWIMVGDELDNNYQALCKDCNLKKNKQIDYYFKKLISID